MNRLLLLLMPLLVATRLCAQDPKLAHLAVRTNAVCDMCEKTIETELLYEKGVKSVDVDLEANIIHVSVDPKKTDVMKVRTAISKLGYSADDVGPDMAAREKLPDCCKKEGCGMPPAKPEQKN
jgi:periplasmic mercuric ion binding protein